MCRLQVQVPDRPVAVKLEHIELTNWKNFARVSLPIGQRTLFVGPNASGKSNLLDAFRFLRDICVSEGGGLQSAVKARDGLSAIRFIGARRNTRIGFRVTLSDGTADRWVYELELEGIRKDTRAKVAREYVSRNGDPVIERPDRQDQQDPERLTETAIEQTSANKQFREMAEFFRSISYLHIVPQIMRSPTLAEETGTEMYGGDLLRRMHAVNKNTLKARLKRMNEALRIAVPQLDELQLETDQNGAPHLRAKYQHWRPQGAWQREDQFSDGTLRLLGMMWSLMERGGPLLMEEPEISLHPAVAAHLPAVISRATRTSRRQVIVTTHSLDILSDESLGLDEAFLLVPGEGGTDVKQASTIDDAMALMRDGVSLGEIAQAKTRPKRIENIGQLDLFPR
jgi:predicted ATPase